MAMLPGWAISGKEEGIAKTYRFNDFHQTMAFVNAVAEVANAEDHHPDMEVSYNRCTVKFDTHSVNAGRGGISENDFICAAKVDAIFQQSFALNN